jgi:hypothetical protein
MEVWQELEELLFDGAAEGHEEEKGRAEAGKPPRGRVGGHRRELRRQRQRGGRHRKSVAQAAVSAQASGVAVAMSQY